MGPTASYVYTTELLLEKRSSFVSCCFPSSLYSLELLLLSLSPLSFGSPGDDATFLVEAKENTGGTLDQRERKCSLLGKKISRDSAPDNIRSVYVNIKGAQISVGNCSGFLDSSAQKTYKNPLFLLHFLSPPSTYVSPPPFPLSSFPPRVRHHHPILFCSPQHTQQ